MNNINFAFINYISDKSANIMTNIIYNNFVELEKYAILKHTIDDIKKLLKNKKMVLIVASINKKIVGYIIGENITLDDGRKTLFISYFYVGKKYRGVQIGTKLLNLFISKAIKQKLDGVLLIVDTENTKLVNYYFMKKFMYDLNLRRYAKHEVLFLTLH